MIQSFTTWSEFSIFICINKTFTLICSHLYSILLHSYPLWHACQLHRWIVRKKQKVIFNQGKKRDVKVAHRWAKREKWQFGACKWWQPRRLDGVGELRAEIMAFSPLPSPEIFHSHPPDNFYRILNVFSIFLPTIDLVLLFSRPFFLLRQCNTLERSRDRDRPKCLTNQLGILSYLFFSSSSAHTPDCWAMDGKITYFRVGINSVCSRPIKNGQKWKLRWTNIFLPT